MRSDRRRWHPALDGLEGRRLLSASPFEPTAEEQYMLELINRARSDPPAEGRRLLALARSDPAVRRMSRRTSLPAFARILSRTRPLPPLAFDPRLIEAARDAAAVLLATNDQRHSPRTYLVDPAVATADDGAPYYPVGPGSWGIGENLFAYSGNVAAGSPLKTYVDYLHAGLMLDWGNPDFGHLRNLLAPGAGPGRPGGRPPFREIGIGLLADAEPTAPPAGRPALAGQAGFDVGPVIVVQEFGWRSDRPAQLVGAAYRDQDADRFYTPGEGLGGVSITAVGRHGEGTFRTTTWGSGGYALALPNGTYEVTATPPGELPTRSIQVCITGENVAWDLVY